MKLEDLGEEGEGEKEHVITCQSFLDPGCQALCLPVPSGVPASVSQSNPGLTYSDVPQSGDLNRGEARICAAWSLGSDNWP